MVFLASDTFPALLFPAYFVALLFLLTIANRTMGIEWIAATFLLGASVVPIIAGLLTLPFGLLLGTDSGFFSSFIVPVLEETIKIVPVVLLLFLPRRSYRWTLSATDLLVLGAAVGAGFAFYEETLLGFLPGFSAETILSMHTGTPHLGPFYLFPNMDVQIGAAAGLPTSAFIGHGGAAAFIALAIGLARLLGSWLKRLLRGGWVVVWIIPVIVWGWMVFDHALYNYAADASSMPPLLRIPYTLDGFGYLSSIVLYLLILVTIGVEQVLLWKGRERVKDLRLSPDRLRLLKGALKSPLEIPLHLLGLRASIQARRGLIFGGYGQQPEEVETKREEHLNELARHLQVLKKLLELPEEEDTGQDEPA
jgi:RsiW-degrading membrane proteinase PrsW (M82 family)